MDNSIIILTASTNRRDMQTAAMYLCNNSNGLSLFRSIYYQEKDKDIKKTST